MTIAPPDGDQEVEVRDATVEPDAPIGSPQGLGWKRLALLGGVVVAVCVAIVLLFEGPLATTWYHARQSARAGDLTAQRPGIAPGQALATLQIPRIKLNVVVVEGDGVDELRGGPGHRLGTPIPGKRGNSVILGHRSGWGGSFADLPKLRSGDLIAIQVKNAQDVIVYKVVSTRRFSSDDIAPMLPSADNRVTLITSNGGATGGDRLAVTAVSGKVIKESPSAVLRPDRSAGDSSSTLMFTVALGAIVVGAVALMFLRRRRYRGPAVAAVLVPIGLAGTLAMLLALDATLLPLLR